MITAYNKLPKRKARKLPTQPTVYREVLNALEAVKFPEVSILKTTDLPSRLTLSEQLYKRMLEEARGGTSYREIKLFKRILGLQVVVSAGLPKDAFVISLKGADATHFYKTAKTGAYH